jgi:hypothetical protein
MKFLQTKHYADHKEGTLICKYFYLLKWIYKILVKGTKKENINHILRNVKIFTNKVPVLYF